MRRRRLQTVTDVCRTLVILAAASAGCQSQQGQLSADNPELSQFISLVMPREIQIQRYLTKPVSVDKSGDLNGIEVILQALDSVRDPVKCVGTFHFELRTRRLASSDRLGKRIGFWKLDIRTTDAMAQYWDKLSRCYRFPLQLREGTVQPGQYVLTATLVLPTGDKLYDEYDFTHEGAAPPPAAGAP